MTSGDIAAIVGSVTTLITAAAGAMVLIRRNSGELSEREQREVEECSAKKRAALRVVRILRDLLAELGIPEPEGLDDELAGRKADEKTA